MPSSVLSLHDAARDRALPTHLHLPDSPEPPPLVVFGHGYWGHPRKFARLFARLVSGGYAVAAPVFPLTNDEGEPPYVLEDVVNQPADVSFVLDELAARGIGDPRRVGVAGFSLGAETALAVALHPRHADPRVRAVAAVAGCLFHGDLATRDLRPVPLLLVHGTEDESVPYAEALAVYAAAHEPKELVTLEGAGHQICQDEDEPYASDVAELLAAFFDRWVRPL